MVKYKKLLKKGDFYMIGLGKWACNVNSMFFSGEVKFTISDNNGEYDFEIEIPGVDIPDFTLNSIEEDDETLTILAETSLLPGKEAEVVINFDDDTFDGFLKVPFIGKVKFKDGHRIEE